MASRWCHHRPNRKWKTDWQLVNRRRISTPPAYVEKKAMRVQLIFNPHIRYQFRYTYQLFLILLAVHLLVALTTKVECVMQTNQDVWWWTKVINFRDDTPHHLSIQGECEGTNGANDGQFCWTNIKATFSALWQQRCLSLDLAVPRTSAES